MIVATVVVVLLLFHGAEGLTCKNCFNCNMQQVYSAHDCQADTCLYEQINMPDGRIHMLKTCASSTTYTFDDGVNLDVYNQCVTRTTNVGQYYVMLCNTGDYCNLSCKSSSVQPTVIPPIGPTPSGGPVTCYNCETSDGTDCQSATCQGAFCLYERRISGSRMFLRKSCLVEPVLMLDDNTIVDGVDVCEVRNTVSSRYYVKICNNVNLCNNYCNPGQQQPYGPQRQPMLTCYNCDGYGSECFTGSCQGQYCLFEQERRTSSGTTYIKKACSSLPFVEYPDNTVSTALNRCEYRTINDIEYQIKLCDTGDRCNTGCTPQPTQRSMTCTSCEGNNQDDCVGSSCQGLYCIFEKSQSLTSAQSYVKKSCTNAPLLAYPDQSPYTAFGQCDSRNINGVVYTLKLCNSTNYCNSACSDSYQPTTSPPQPQRSSASGTTTLMTIYTVICIVRSLLCK